jgi:outer membrane protein assembly factor BamB
VSGDHVYVLGVVGDLGCFKLSDGSKVWGKNLKADFDGSIPKWGYAESPLVDEGKVVCLAGGKGGMVALDAKTGATVWQCKDFNHDTGYSSAVVADVGGVRQYVTQTMVSGVGVRAKDGKLLWQAGEIKRSVAVIPTPVVADGHVFLTCGYNGGSELVKLEPDGAGGTKATLVYSNKDKLMSNHHGNVVQIGDVIYGHTDHRDDGASDRQKGTWVAINWKTPSTEPLWRSDKLEKGSVTYADGLLYCYGENNGTVVCVKASPTAWEEIGRFNIPQKSKTRPGQGKVWPHPVVANGKLFLRDYEMLYCYDLKAPGS